MGILSSLFGMGRSVADAEARMNSPQYRLSQPHFWTDAAHAPDAGASQMMRLPDGNFLVVSMAIDTAMVFVAPDLTAPNTWSHVGTLQLTSGPRRLMSRSQRRAADEVLLERLRKAIGWPKNANEVNGSIASLPSGLLE